MSHSSILSPDCCSAEFGSECSPTSCRWRCALEVIDELLSQGTVITGEQADLFLDLRWQLAQREKAEEALRLFSHLRVSLEASHYLPLFRIRKWMENHLQARVVSPGGVTIPITLAHAYCVEALRRQCLCVAVKSGFPLGESRLVFEFNSHAIPQASQAKAALASLSV